MGYDMVRFFEKIPDKNPDDLAFYDCVFLLSETLIIFDHRTHKIKIVTNVSLDDFKDSKSAYRYAIETIEDIYKRLRSPLRLKFQSQIRINKFKITSNFTKDGFKRAVLKAKEYIRKGDIIQVVLSQRFKLRLTSEPFAIYRNLRSLNPSPYMYYLKLNGVYLIGSSPETLVRCEFRPLFEKGQNKGSSVCIRPIAGTRPRGMNEKEDRILESQLLEDSKEKAEHLMLVDLGRNDLGKVCECGSVNVREFMKIERYSHVMHLVSEVVGKLRKDKDIFDLLRATFPAGTVTGAPKIRAMEIIDEMENTKEVSMRVVSVISVSQEI
jgi:anthranilate synthase component 1